MNIIITVILLCTLSSFIKLFSFRYLPKYFENDDMTMMLIMCMCIHIYPFFLLKMMTMMLKMRVVYTNKSLVDKE